MMSRRFRRLGLVILGPIVVGAVLLTLPLFPPVDLTRVAVPPGADSVMVAAGERYRAGAAWQFFLGRHWRDLWTQPLKVEVLKLHDLDGGLLAVKEGGGLETRSLHFVSRSGHHFVFRSTDKELVRLFPVGLSRSLLARIVQDQTCASHPASTLVAALLQSALGLPATHPRLVVLPADSLLGAYRDRFAGLMGTLQEGPVESLPDPPPGQHLPDIKDTGEVLARLDSLGREQADARGFLTARLLDFLLNDWDRHSGQWRWASTPHHGHRWWQPIPVDRDQAFARYDGLLLDLARLRTTKLSSFGPEYPELQSLIQSSDALDRRLFGMLPRSVWDSVRGFVEARLSDSVVDAAVRQMPDVYQVRSGAMLASALKERRGRLSNIATEYYQRLARQPEVHVGAGATADLTYQSDGSVELRFGAEAEGRELLRHFEPGETGRVDVYLHGGPAQLTVHGSRSGVIEVHLFDGQGHELRAAAGANPARTAARASRRTAVRASG